MEAPSNAAMDSLNPADLRSQLLLDRFSRSGTGAGQRAALERLRVLAAAAPVPPAAAPGSAPFLAALDAFERECHRVAAVYAVQHEQLWSAVLNAVGQLRDGSAPSSSAEGLAAVRAALDAVAEATVDLDGFVTRNSRAVAIVAAAADGAATAADAAVAESYRTAAESALIGSLRVDSIIMALSDAYELLRQAEAGAVDPTAAAAATWVAPRSFSRTTRKFWLRPADVVRFKIEVIKHLPVLVYGRRRSTGGASAAAGLAAATPEDLPFLRPGALDSDSSLVTSVYLDALPELESYRTRLSREHGATAVRLRWYGHRDPVDPFQSIFAERKTHREGMPRGMGGLKERAELPQGEVPALLCGGALAAAAGDTEDAEFLAGLQAQILERRASPLVRTRYRRTAFQSEAHNRIRISMDMDLRMSADSMGTVDLRVAADGAASAAAGHWCRPDDDAVAAAADTLRFPYVVVEVKLQEDPPQWLLDLVRAEVPGDATAGDAASRPLLLPSPKFSKFLHGTAVLYQDCVEVVPYWFLPEEEGTNGSGGSGGGGEGESGGRLTPATWHEMAMYSAAAVGDAGAWIYPESAPAIATGEELGATATEEDPAAAALPPKPLWRWRGRRRESGIAGGPDTPEGKSPRADVAAEQGAAAQSQLLAAATSGTEVKSPRKSLWKVYQAPPSAATAPGKGGAGSDTGTGSSDDQEQEMSATDGSSSAGGRGTPVDAQKDLEAGTGGGTAPATPALVLLADAQGQLGQMGPLGAAVSKSAASPQLKPSLPLLPTFAVGGRGGGGGSSGLGSPKRPPPRPILRSRVEPKTFFANERTFMAWLQISVLVMFLAMSLLNGSVTMPGVSSAGSTTTAGACGGNTMCIASRVSGALIAPVALAFMAYALYQYRRRTLQILRAETVRIDDQRGPALLVAILLAVMIISYVIALVAGF